MTDLELAAALREALAAAPTDYPQTRAQLARPPAARARPMMVRVSTIHEPTGPAPRRMPEGVVPAGVEQRILAELADQQRVGETIANAFRRKEHALTAVFAQLQPLEARTLHRRLSTARADDALALAFGRLATERRVRLLAYLEDARRRHAVVVARGAA